MYGILLQPVSNYLNQFIAIELGLQIHSGGIVGKDFDVQCHFAADGLHLGEMIHQTVVEVIHIGNNCLFQQHIHIGCERRSSCSTGCADGFIGVSIACLQDIGQ